MANNLLFFTDTQFRGEGYKDYFDTSHWKNLNEQLIDTNPSAKCFICGKLYTLLIHHESYENLFGERLNRDVFILCFKCHSSLHFYEDVHGRKVKTPLIYKNLKRRRLFMRLQYVLKNRYMVLSIGNALRYMLCL